MNLLLSATYFLLTILFPSKGYALFTPNIKVSSEYDIIFAGGGTAASIIAGRLSVAAPHLRILVLEAGPTTRQKIEHIQPGRFFTHIMPFSTTEQFTVSNPSDYVAGRNIVIPSGKCIGGGSSVNFMLYNRPSASDYDDWETEFDNPGWGSKVLIPLLQKAETYEVNLTAKNHGSTGPIHVSYGDEFFEVGKQFLDIGPRVERNRPFSDEGNDLTENSINVFYRMPKWISGRGRRSDAPHHYLFPQENNRNLVISHGSRVVRVTFDKTRKRATGVEFVYDKHVFPDYDHSVNKVAAAKLVVLSAGAMGTPIILERSGIGSKTLLDNFDIQLVVDLPGVGATYRDHIFAVSPYLIDDNATTFDPIFRGDATAWTDALVQWDVDGTGIMASNGVDAAIKMRPTDEEVVDIGPEFKARWDEFYANKPDKPLFWLSALGGLPADQTGLPAAKFMSSGCFLGYPASVGSLHISSTDVYAPPNYDSGFLSDFSDVAALRWGYKKGREILRRMPVFRGALVPAHPQFKEGSRAALNETAPVAIDAPNIVYSEEDNRAIDDYLRALVGTSWHSLGTAPMKPREQDGVVDPRLNVHGVKGLKIADLSIPPQNVNANTYSTTIAISEKAFLIIAEELGIFVEERKAAHDEI